ncbi:MAG TPA: hypothetical protein DD666_06325 [Advenella kashmirensis]|uniref:Uncharacterized protein n=1 Tax=Advenella kashmirensis TaxID=310575 RepID=A0A356LDE1_9BURK|nr:hypothetical protein [Advenella kashmirensis]
MNHATEMAMLPLYVFMPWAGASLMNDFDGFQADPRLAGCMVHAWSTVEADSTWSWRAVACLPMQDRHPGDCFIILIASNIIL